MEFKDILKYYTEKINMEIINRSQEKPSTTIKVQVLTIKKYISKNGYTGEEVTESLEPIILNNIEDLKNKIADIALFNKKEESKLQQEGFNQNYILMKKLINQ